MAELGSLRSTVLHCRAGEEIRLWDTGGFYNPFLGTSRKQKKWVFDNSYIRIGLKNQ